MIAPAGYTLGETVYASPRTTVARARRDADGQPVIVKTLTPDYPPLADVAGIRREFQIASSLQTSGIVRPYGLLQADGRPVLVMEDFGGRSLLEVLRAGPLDPVTFLETALRIAEILQVLHASGVVHKDINPANILVSRDLQEVRITDFGISSLLSRENPTVSSANRLEGTLLYLSPEQTGRMNRALDYRTDLYSLGVTFYEMLVGQPPFQSDDAMELVHCHIARTPPSPAERNEDVPEALSAIVMKLMSKRAEDRYQSAYGLATDLRECLRQLRGGGRILGFVPAQHDISGAFQIPQKLYGREREVETLLRAFERASEGEARMLLVSGFSGIGKTALVNEIQKPIVRRRGYFIAGKFGQFRRSVPYESLIQAFQELVRQLLTESEERISGWKAQLLEALGPNAQVVVNALPDVERIVGPQPPVAELGAEEARNRFNLVFQAFVGVFATADHPLALFLDDLQWADTASLELLSLLLTDRVVTHLFLIGAYRDNEVDPAHPLVIALDALRERGTAIEEIRLQPLEVSHLEQIVADTFRETGPLCRALAELVHRKTSGNPFFVLEFLRALCQEGLIEFNPGAGRWLWSAEAIEGRQITDNVVEFLSGKIRRLPPEVQETLKLAACTGSTFDLRTVSVLAETTLHAAAVRLSKAVAEGLAAPIGTAYRYFEGQDEGISAEVTEGGASVRYRFLHDRVQQAAYGLVPEEQRRQLHLRIGRLMLRSATGEEREERVFDIATHLNLGAPLMEDGAERESLAEINLLAGRKAKLSTAYRPALQYLTAACDLLGEAAWTARYDLLFSLTLDRAECEHLCEENEAAERHLDEALAHARDRMDQARVYERKIHFYTNTGRFAASYAAGGAALKLFGITVPNTKNVMPVLLREFARAKLALRGKKTGDLLALPEMRDEGMRASVKLISGALKAAYQVMPQLCIANAITSVNLSLRHGNMEDNPIAYMVFGGIFMGGVQGDHKSGFELGQLALALIDRFNNVRQKAEVNFVYAYFAHSWRRSYPETEEYYQRAYESGLESGDLFHCGCAASAMTQSFLMRGRPLEEVRRETDRYLEFVRRVENRDFVGAVTAVQRAVLCLQGGTRDPLTFDGEGFDEGAFEEELRKFGSQHFAHYYWVNRMQALYLHDAPEKALDAAGRSETFLRHSIGMMHMVEHHFYHALILARLLREAPPGRRAGMAKRLHRNERMFRKWAAECPPNFEHKHLLLAAEAARVAGRDALAGDHYDRAIRSAQESGFPQNEALANELAGRFYLERGKEKVARAYLSDARYGYLSWGAATKVALLDARFPHLAGTGLAPARGARTSVVDSQEIVSGALDLMTVVKASQALAGEIVLDRLLQKLMETVLENAGAQRGLLLLETDGRWRIEAEGAVDREDVRVLQSEPAEGCGRLSPAIVKFVERTGEPVVLADATRDGIFGSDPYVQETRPRSVLCMPLMHQGKPAGMLYLENNLATGAFTSDRLEVLRILSGQAAISIENARLYRNMAELNVAYERFVPQQFLYFLGKRSIMDVVLGDQVNMEMTLLFSDIRSFTRLSEQMSPEETFRFINVYLGLMEPAIKQNQGFIDKYVGDGIMALFPRSADDAVRASLDMLRELAAFNEGRASAGKPSIRIGIGLNTGLLMLGTVGGPDRMTSTVISDAVNLASRMEGMTKLFRVALLISEETHSRLRNPGRYAIRQIDRVQAQGKTRPITVYEVFDGDAPESLERKLRTRPAFEAGVDLYQKGEFAAAAERFARVREADPEDYPAELYVSRCEHHLRSGAPEEWQGVSVLEEK
jgi:predicted ATPase/class 3 adenylate cyclase/GAF domain-containing protein